MSEDSNGAVVRLDEAVERLLARLEETRAEAAALAAVGTGTGETQDPAELAGRLRRLEAENEELLERLRSGHDIVQRLMAKIRFLEEKK